MSDVPWSAIVGTRTRIAHDYRDFDTAIAEQIIDHDLPLLRRSIQRYLFGRR
jgi:uncharacterized protein with HEPN domain